MKNSIKINISLISCALLYVCTCSAQFQLNNRMVQQNKFGINPAYAGEKDTVRIALVGSFAKAKITNSNDYFWQQATIDIPLKSNLSTGTIFSNIAHGSFSQIQIKQIFSYKVKFSENQSLSVGFSFGLNRASLNYNNGYNPNDYVDLSDPYLNKENYSKNDLGLEIGAVYNFKNFQISLAAPAILQDNGNYRGITAYTQYKFVINNEWDVVPSVLMLQTQQKQYEFTTSVNAMYMNKAWIQMGYVDVSQFEMGIGFNIKGLGIGYDISFPFDRKYSSLVGTMQQLGLFFNL